jgi:hypothetical protein
MEYGLHLTPQKTTPAIQAQIDALPAPGTVLIGYGLCGNGLVGLKSRHRRLLDVARARVAAGEALDLQEFVIIRPGEEVRQEPFMSGQTL